MAQMLSFTIITPVGTLTKLENVEVIVANTTTGQIAILPEHIPLFTRLEHGEIKIKAEGKNHYFTIFQGFLHLSPDNKVTVMADNAQRSEELNVEAIRKARENAEKALDEKEKLSATEILKAETAIRRAIMELKVAQHKKPILH